MIEKKDFIEIEQEKNDDIIETILAGLDDNAKIQIIRRQPAEVSGFLEDIEIDPGMDQSVLLSYIAKVWGGKRFTLRFKDHQGKYRKQAEIDLSSHPPKFRGKVLSRDYNGYFVGEDNEQRPIENVRQQTPQQQIQVPQPQHNFENINPISSAIEILARTRKEDLQLLQNLLGQQPSHPPQVFNGFSQMIEMVHMMKELREVLGDADKKMESNDENKLFGMIGDVIKSLTTQKQPIQHKIPIYKQPVNQPLQQIVKQPIHKNDVKNLENILLNMDPKRAAELCLSALGRMDENNRNLAIMHFLSCTEENPNIESSFEGFENDENSEIDDDKDNELYEE